LNHLVLKIDALLDFDGIRAKLESFYSEIRHSFVDPELMTDRWLVSPL
jgi:hypothetical protein